LVVVLDDLIGLVVAKVKFGEEERRKVRALLDDWLRAMRKKRVEEASARILCRRGLEISSSADDVQSAPAFLIPPSALPSLRLVALVEKISFCSVEDLKIDSPFETGRRDERKEAECGINSCTKLLSERARDTHAAA
jgi:hypothetical protein